MTNIEPSTITTVKTATSFTTNCISLELFKSATFAAMLFDSDNNLISNQIIKLTEEQYLEWNNNDDYIINLVAGVLGVKVVP